MDFFQIMLVMFIVIFALTAMIAILSLFGLVKLPSSIRNKLFNVLLIEVVLSVFSTFNYLRDYNYFKVFKTVQDPAIWDGFQGEYRAYNDSWLLEMEDPDRYIDVHRKRYLKQSNRFKYIFYINPDYPPERRFESFSRFVMFQAMVHLRLTKKQVVGPTFYQEYQKLKQQNAIPESVNQVEVHLLYSKEVPSITYFVGNRETALGTKSTAIVYLIADKLPLIATPYQIIETNNRDLYNHLTNHWSKERNTTYCKRESYEGEAIFDKYFGIQSNGL